VAGKLAVTAKRVAGRFSRDNETAVLQRDLAAFGWTVRLFDWRDIAPFTGPLPDLVATSDVLLHRYLGSLREQCIQPTHRYVALARERFAGAIVNDPDLLRYGCRKHYLFDYQRRGFPMVPSLYQPSWAGIGTLRRAAAEAGWRAAVVKPIDGELCQDVHLLADVSSERYQALASRTSGFVVQPFLEGIRHGQRSVLLVVIGGEPVPVYGMVKVPNGWHARANLSTVRESAPSTEERELAIRLLDGWPGGHIVNGFARVDFIVDHARLYVLEVETVNPEGGLPCASRVTQRRWVAHVSEMLGEAARRATASCGGAAVADRHAHRLAMAAGTPGGGEPDQLPGT
jgi:glutathione synthase/RimK-type ligase-like ATP-grasp enzyme